MLPFFIYAYKYTAAILYFAYAILYFQVKKLRREGPQMDGKKQIVQMVGRTRMSPSLRYNVVA